MGWPIAALPGIGFGVVVDVGHVGGQRMPLLRHVLRIDGKDLSEKQLKKSTLNRVAGVLDQDGIAILDAGVKSLNAKKLTSSVMCYVWPATARADVTLCLGKPVNEVVPEKRETWSGLCLALARKTSSLPVNPTYN